MTSASLKRSRPVSASPVSYLSSTVRIALTNQCQENRMLSLRKSLAIIPLFASLGMYAEVETIAESNMLEVGDIAPDWTLPGSDGETYKLSKQLKKNAVVVLAWYPKAYTRGCTIECKSLKEKGHLIRKFNVTYFMASVDPIEDQTGFAQQQEADFPLLADDTQETANAYGVMTPKGYPNRHTFYIGKNRRILQIDRQVKPSTAAEDIAANLAKLGIERISDG